MIHLFHVHDMGTLPETCVERFCSGRTEIDTPAQGLAGHTLPNYVPGARPKSLFSVILDWNRILEFVFHGNSPTKGPPAPKSLRN